MMRRVSDSGEIDESKSVTDAHAGDDAEAGDDPVMPVQFEISLPLKARLDALAAARGLTYSEIVHQALVAWLNAEDDGSEAETLA